MLWPVSLFFVRCSVFVLWQRELFLLFFLFFIFIYCIELAKKLVQVFSITPCRKSEQSFWPTQYIPSSRISSGYFIPIFYLLTLPVFSFIVSIFSLSIAFFHILEHSYQYDNYFTSSVSNNSYFITSFNIWVIWGLVSVDCLFSWKWAIVYVK